MGERISISTPCQSNGDSTKDRASNFSPTHTLFIRIYLYALAIESTANFWIPFDILQFQIIVSSSVNSLIPPYRPK